MEPMSTSLRTSMQREANPRALIAFCLFVTQDRPALHIVIWDGFYEPLAFAVRSTIQKDQAMHMTLRILQECSPWYI